MIPKKGKWNCLGRDQSPDSTLIHLSSIIYTVSEEKPELNTDKNKKRKNMKINYGSEGKQEIKYPP